MIGLFDKFSQCVESIKTHNIVYFMLFGPNSSLLFCILFFYFFIFTLLPLWLSFFDAPYSVRIRGWLMESRYTDWESLVSQQKSLIWLTRQSSAQSRWKSFVVFCKFLYFDFCIHFTFFLSQQLGIRHFLGHRSYSN